MDLLNKVSFQAQVETIVSIEIVVAADRIVAGISLLNITTAVVAFEVEFADLLAILLDYY